MNKVPFLDVTAANDELREQLDEAYRRVVDSGWFVLGEEVEAFEREYAEYCGVRHCIGVGNGLDALHLILRALGIGEGDEVIVPSHTFIATWLAVSYAGAKPVPVEPDEGTFNIDPSRLESAITSRTRAIVPVHLYGRPADMEAIRAVAERHDLKVIEDAAQAHGATYQGCRAGSLADAAAFSFYPAKNLGALGDGGAVLTDDATLEARVRELSNYGSKSKYDFHLRGFNSRLDPLQAAFLRAKLRRLEDWNRRRAEVAGQYLERLSDLPGLVLPSVPHDSEPAWHLFVVRHSGRDRLKQALDDQGIETLAHYPVPPHLSGAYAGEGWSPGDLPVAERLSASVLSLPMGPHLGEDDVAIVAAAMKRIG